MKTTDLEPQLYKKEASLQKFQSSNKNTCGDLDTEVFYHANTSELKVCINLVPRVLLGTKVPWWIVVTWVRFIAQILGNKTICYCIYFSNVLGLKLTSFNCSINQGTFRNESTLGTRLGLHMKWLCSRQPGVIIVFHSLPWLCLNKFKSSTELYSRSNISTLRSNIFISVQTLCRNVVSVCIWMYDCFVGFWMLCMYEVLYVWFFGLISFECFVMLMEVLPLLSLLSLLFIVVFSCCCC